MPAQAFDAHAHLYDLRHLVPAGTPPASADSAISDPQKPEIDHHALVDRMQHWMGDRVVRSGLYFPLPAANLDCAAANRFLADAIRGRPDCRGLMMVRPDDDPAQVETQLRTEGFAGFKVYHLFAPRDDTMNADAADFVPEWAWELADQYGLVIMLHLVRAKALSDPRNQQYIRSRCLRYRNARVVLAHAARGFNARHTSEAIAKLRDLPNAWFDSSAVCEPTALEAIIQTFGVTRLMYGSDFPVSELRGRSVSVGDGFYWLHDDNAEWDDWSLAKPQLVGLESLLALRQACRTMKLIDRDVERIFAGNAIELLNLQPPVDASLGESHDKSRGGSNLSLDELDVQSLYRRAKQIIPGGTQLLSKRPEMYAPERWPAYFEQAVGCEVVDTDGRRYIDMSHCGILSCILGFADPDVNAAVIRRVQLGNMATQQTADEVELTQLLLQLHPWAQQARYTRSGGEAMAVATRIARAATGKNRVIVCGYHGWHDWYLAANLKTASSELPLDEHLLSGLAPRGVPTELAGTVATFRYNDLAGLDNAIEFCDDDLAAIIMEPTRSSDPAHGFLEGVRERADSSGAALVFDEISSAWRYHCGGAHLMFGVEPDVAVFAKAISNGFPMAAVIGRRKWMDACQQSFISSTSWTEGTGPAAALATVRKLMSVDVPTHLERIGRRVMQGWQVLAARHGLPLHVSGRPASASMRFDHAENDALLTLMTAKMLNHGYLASGTCSLTFAHQMHHVESYLIALDDVFAQLASAIADGDLARLAAPVKHTGFRRLVD